MSMHGTPGCWTVVLRGFPTGVSGALWVGMMINDTGAFGELEFNLSESDALGNSSTGALRLEVKSLVTSTIMFAVGVLGNLIAIIVLCVSKKEQKETTFYTLVCGMAVTDLLGTCFTSPVVIATYMAGRWPGGALLCHFFSFSMLFFGSAGMSILCVMAVERYLAINHAYFYSQHIDRIMARFALLLLYLLNIVLCVLPSFGFGQHVRHYPGTWCFLDWRAVDPLGASYSFLYGGVMLVLIAATVLCNLAVCRSLVGMNQRTGIVRTELCKQGGSRRRFPRFQSVSSAAEIQMFWLLVFMTIVFLVCSVPLVVRIFVNQIYDAATVSTGGHPDYRGDLLAIRFASFNPILDPWVYILCRKNLLLKGCERLKRTMARVKDGTGENIGWTGAQNSPPSSHSNETSYASLRTAGYRNEAKQQLSVQNKSFTDFTVRHAWEEDVVRVNFHPFSVDSPAILGSDEDGDAHDAQCPRRSGNLLPSAATHRGGIGTCTFSSPSTCRSAKCL